MELTDLIKVYYEVRGLVYPDVWQALAFATTEMGEAYEILFSREDKYVRNNPDSKPKFNKEDLAKELGDILMMVIVAGMSEGVDPVVALKDKIETKLEKLGLVRYKQATFTSSSVEVE